ncbi:MAG TPA: C4-type zinc ribbon domain-containing protein [Acidimicrobiia bacterium]|nr:C4-type zinc ribbon domain-containing protein [Acidimicrobiia bacterium]
MTSLEPLLALQERDLALDRLAHQRADLAERGRLSGLSMRVAELAATRDARRAERDEVAVLEQRFAAEVEHLEQQAVAAEARLYSGEVSSPRELQALQADVEQLRRHRRAVEDRQLGAMEQREPLDEALAVLDGEVEALEAEAAEVRRVLEERERELDAAAAEEQSARDTVATQIDAHLISDYEQRRQRARGVGAARLVGMTCQGCHLSIPATEVDRIRRQPTDAIAYCDNCGCILVP